VCNAALPAADIEHHCAIDAAGRDLLHRAAERLGWSGRGPHRVLKLSRTIADLQGGERIGPLHIAEATQWRRALPAVGT
jgi:magnesium chelatase family protein